MSLDKIGLASIMIVFFLALPMELYVMRDLDKDVEAPKVKIINEREIEVDNSDLFIEEDELFVEFLASLLYDKSYKEIRYINIRDELDNTHEYTTAWSQVYANPDLEVTQILHDLNSMYKYKDYNKVYIESKEYSVNEKDRQLTDITVVLKER